MKFDFRQPPRSGDEVAVLEGVHKAYGTRVVYDGLSLTIRRGERWCVMGRNGAGKTTLLKMVAGALPPDAGAVTLGASLKMGYFAQQALDLLDPALTVLEQMQKDFPREGIGVLRNLLGAFQFSGRRRREADPRAVGRREVAPGAGADAVRPAELPRPRRADQPPRSRDQGDAGRGAAASSRGRCCSCRTTARSCAGSSNRVLELGGETGVDAEPHAYPGSYVEYVQRTGHEAPGVHA